MTISTYKVVSTISNDEWIDRYNQVYSTIGSYFLHCSWCVKEYWSWEAANVMESLNAMFKATGNIYYLEELEKMCIFVLDNEGGYGASDSNFTSNVFCPIVKFARFVQDNNLTQFDATKTRIINFMTSYVVPYVMTWMKEFTLDNIQMVTQVPPGGNGPMPFNQQDQTFIWLLHLSYLINEPSYRTLFQKFANFVKWSRNFVPCCFDTSKTTYTLAYRRYTGLSWDNSSGEWCSSADCAMELGYAGSHVDLVMEGYFHGIGFTKADVEYITNGFVYGMWNQDEINPLINRNMGGCGQNMAPYSDWHSANLTGELENFPRIGVVNSKVLEICEKIIEKVYLAGSPSSNFWTKVYKCVTMTDGSGNQSCYSDMQEQPDWLLREIAHVLTTRSLLPAGPGPECLVGETRCNGNVLQQCVDGTFTDTESCAYGCSNNECNAPPTSECTNGQFQCNGNVRQFCSNGQWINTETCAYGCTDGVCNAAPPPGCTDGTFRCNGNVRQMCIGGEWIDIDTCANGCSGGECQEPPACTDGQSRCNGNYRQVCINGSYIDIESCENGCSNGQCSEQPAQNNNTMLYVIGGVALLGVLGSMMAMRK